MLDGVSASALDDARELAALIPDAELALIDDAGHLPLLSRPKVVADHLAEFLTTTLATTT